MPNINYELPDKLHRALKAQAAKEGITIEGIDPATTHHFFTLSLNEDLVCDFCGSMREVQAFPEWAGVPPHNKCRVCSRLLGTNVTEVASNRDLMLAIVALFHTLDLTPWDSDQEIPADI